MKGQSKLVRYANAATITAVLWALMGGLLLALQPHLMLWWHPLCDDTFDGPGYFADGFPLPYQEWSQASSMEFNFMPHIFLLDVVILAGIFYVFCRAIFGRIVNGTPVGRTLFLAIGIAGSLFALLYFVWTWRTEYWPVRSIAIWQGESYFSYRPAFLRPARSHPCNVY